MDGMTRKTRELAGGHTSHDTRLDRVPQWDDRNAGYPIAELVALAPPPPPPGPEHSRTWRAGPVLDQGQHGYCVGYSFAGEAAADPVPVDVHDPAALDALANELYQAAHHIWPGDSDGEGSSILAGAKAAQARGLFDEYRWGAPTGTVDELVRVLDTGAGNPDAAFGPAVLGVTWYDGMFEPDEHGIITVAGPVAGGHAILCRGVIMRPRFRGVTEPLLRLRNSWADTFGAKGDCLIRASDVERILGAEPEVCYPVRRRRPAARV